MENWQISDKGLRFIAYFEGFKPEMYYCAGGKPTIGFGHVILPNESFGTITIPEAFDLLRSDIRFPIQVTVELKQNQVDALCSFIFNIGVRAFARSTLLQVINKGEVGIALEFNRWIRAGGVVLPGLVKRRNAEADMYINGTYYYQYQGEINGTSI